MRRWLVLIIAVCLVGCTAQPQDDVLVLRGATVYVDPASPPLQDADVQIRGNTIIAVGGTAPASRHEIDCRGRVIVAGLHNSHVHFMGPAWTDAAHAPAARLATQLRRMLTRYGFTTVFDTGSLLDDTRALRERVLSNEIPGPRILTAGEPLFPPDGIPIYLRGLPPSTLQQMKTPATAADAVAAVGGNISRGADAVKLFTGSVMGGGIVLPMPADVAQAAVAEAHRLQVPVFAHPSDERGASIAVAAGVDVLAHTNSAGWTPTLVAMMLEHRTALVPTLALWAAESEHAEGADDSSAALTADAVAELAAFVQGGGEVLFGTDVGYISHFDPSDEYRLMARAGMTPMQILASLTTAPAARFQPTLRLGRVAPGYLADLTVLAGDPAQDVAQFARVRQVLRDGRVIFDSARAR